MTVLPSGWHTVPLTEVLEHSIGGAWGSVPGQDEVDVRVIRVTELKNHGRLDSSTAALRSIKKGQLQTRQLRPGDLLLEKSGGGPKTPVGRVGLVRVVEGPTVCANFMQLMRPNPSLVSARFLHLFLNHFYMQGGTLGMQTASTNIRNIKSSDYFTLPVPVPPLAEQRRIVDLLEEHLSRLDAAEQALERVKLRTNGLLLSALQVLMSDAGGRATTLGEVAKWGSGGTPLTGNRAFYEGGTIPWVNSGDLRDTELTSVPKRITQQGFEKSATKWVPTGAVLVAMYGATIGRLAIATEAVTTNQAVAYAIPGPKLEASFLFWYLRSQRGSLVAAGKGGAQPNISQTVLKAWPILVPSLEVQLNLVEQARELHAAVLRLDGQVQRAIERRVLLRHALLAAGFSGRLTGRAGDMDVVEEMADV